ncbi:MAG: hypothetical protein U0790_09605 [Isosphaeraceae bacterium]
MIIPSPVLQKFTLTRPYVSYIGDQVSSIVLKFCNDKGFAFSSREKTCESLAEKIETGRYRNWSDLDDLFACAIIIPTLVEESEVVEFLESVFETSAIRKRGSARKDPSVFRFEATRFVGRLRFSDVSEINADIVSTCFEVQVRTAFEHAWAVTTHALAYKASSVDWRNLRIAAQLKAAVEQLDSLVLAYRETAEVLVEHKWPDTHARAALENYFKDAVQSGLIPSEMAPGTWQRFCDNLVSLLRASRGSRGRNVEDLASRAIEQLDAEISTFKGESFPRSISLLQLSLGCLTRRKLLSPPLTDYTPLVTPELLDLYPEIVAYQESFDFGDSL